MRGFKFFRKHIIGGTWHLLKYKNMPPMNLFCQWIRDKEYKDIYEHNYTIEITEDFPPSIFSRFVSIRRNMKIKEVPTDTTICDEINCEKKVVKHEMRRGGSVGLCEDHKCPYDCDDCTLGKIDCRDCHNCSKQWAQHNYA